ncbi:DinB family protein [Cohnella sp. GCM10027633]|uniref:DinB family protein n=1 Tax=unclassified Cohnella TaxID=2636738 RepID=UPI00362512AB
MYASIASFIEDYAHESAGTQKLLDRLTDESLKQPITDGYRTLGHIAWHIAGSVDIVAHAGVKYEHSKDDNKPPSAKEIADAYRRSSQALLEAVKTQWTDADLGTVQTIFGQQWSNGKTLGQLVKHEVHHRGQLTILMRQAGLSVSGVYGPAKEEWAYAGMEPPVLR